VSTKSAQVTPPTRAQKPHAQGWKPAFLEALRNSANVRASCRAAGIDRSTAIKARQRDAAFAAAWEEAVQDALDTLTATAWQRATTGGSDRLLEVLLRAYLPEQFGDRLRVDVTSEARRIARELGATPEEEEAAVAEAERILQRRRSEARRQI
jgi:hypothetical protein